MESWVSDGVRDECVMSMLHCFPHFWMRPTDKVWGGEEQGGGVEYPGEDHCLLG
jgi:hypothetical protein